MTYQNRPLSNSMFNLILLNQMLLLQSLDRVDLLIISLLAQDDLTVGSCPNHLHQVKIINAQTAFSNL